MRVARSGIGLPPTRRVAVVVKIGASQAMAQLLGDRTPALTACATPDARVRGGKRPRPDGHLLIRCGGPATVETVPAAKGESYINKGLGGREGPGCLWNCTLSL